MDANWERRRLKIDEARVWGAAAWRWWRRLKWRLIALHCTSRRFVAFSRCKRRTWKLGVRRQPGSWRELCWLCAVKSISLVISHQIVRFRPESSWKVRERLSHIYLGAGSSFIRFTQNFCRFENLTPRSPLQVTRVCLPESVRTSCRFFPLAASYLRSLYSHLGPSVIKTAHLFLTEWLPALSDQVLWVPCFTVPHHYLQDLHMHVDTRLRNHKKKNARLPLASSLGDIAVFVAPSRPWWTLNC